MGLTFWLIYESSEMDVLQSLSWNDVRRLISQTPGYTLDDWVSGLLYIPVLVPAAFLVLAVLVLRGSRRAHIAAFAVVALDAVLEVLEVIYVLFGPHYPWVDEVPTWDPVGKLAVRALLLVLLLAALRAVPRSPVDAGTLPRGG